MTRHSDAPYFACHSESRGIVHCIRWWLV